MCEEDRFDDGIKTFVRDLVLKEQQFLSREIKQNVSIGQPKRSCKAHCTRSKYQILGKELRLIYVFCFITVNIGDFLNRLKASEGEDSVVNSVGDVLEQQVREKRKEKKNRLLHRLIFGPG